METLEIIYDAVKLAYVSFKLIQVISEKIAKSNKKKKDF